MGIVWIRLALKVGIMLVVLSTDYWNVLQLASSHSRNTFVPGLSVVHSLFRVGLERLPHVLQTKAVLLNHLR